MIKVKNVGEAKVILRANGIKVKSSKYDKIGNSGTITTDSSEAQSLLAGYGLIKY